MQRQSPSGPTDSDWGGVGAVGMLATGDDPAADPACRPPSSQD